MPSAPSGRAVSEAQWFLIAATAVGVALCAVALLFVAVAILRRPAPVGIPSSYRSIGAAISAAPAMYMVGAFGAVSIGVRSDLGTAPHFAILALLGLLAWNWWRAGRDRGFPSDRIWIALYSTFLTGSLGLWILATALKSAADW